MANIIKPSGTKQATVSEYDRDRAPAFDDVAGESDLDPHAILADARAEAEQKVREAYEEGLRRGQAAGEKHFNDGVGNAVEALHGVCREMLHARNAFLDSLEPQLVQLSVALAERILEREVQLDPGVVASTARAALERVLDAEKVVLRANPADLAVLRERKPEYLAEFEQIHSIELVPDEAVESGGCIASTNRLEIDARFSEQLANMMAQMLAQSDRATGDAE